MGRTSAKHESAEPREVRVDVAEEEDGLNLKALKEKKIGELAQIARDFNVEGASSLRKQDLIFEIGRAHV